MTNKIDLSNEENFHDNWAKSVDLDNVFVDEFFEACTAPENRIIFEYLGDLNGKKILDIGCGLGESSVYFAKQGAIVTATDLSEEMLIFAHKLAQKHCVKINTVKSFSDKLNFEDGEFDIVYVANLLHHVDIESTLKEIHRVLRENGDFVSWDPLAHNPIINIYRNIAKEVRTEDEHPLKFGELKLFRKYFPSLKYRTTWLFTLLIFVKFYFIERVSPNKERYWKKIIIEHKRLRSFYNILEFLDKIILKVFPFLSRYCWNIVIMAKKS